MESQRDFLSLNDLAQALDVSYWTAWRWAQRGQIRCIRLPSGTLRVPRGELERLKAAKIEQGAVPA